MPPLCRSPLHPAAILLRSPRRRARRGPNFRGRNFGLCAAKWGRVGCRNGPPRRDLSIRQGMGMPRSRLGTSNWDCSGRGRLRKPWRLCSVGATARFWAAWARNSGLDGVFAGDDSPLVILRNRTASPAPPPPSRGATTLRGQIGGGKRGFWGRRLTSSPRDGPGAQSRHETRGGPR